MSSTQALLPSRSIIRIGGADRLAFLQGLVSNDVSAATEKTAVYAALLTPQGKFLHDMFIVAQGETLLLDVERNRRIELLNRLSSYKLRAKVTIEDVETAFDIWALWGSPTYPAPSFADPRLSDLGARQICPKGTVPANSQDAGFDAYDRHRLTLGIAEDSRDLIPGKTTLAEANFDLLNGIHWKKGCYVGQELTARMHYRGLTKKRFIPVLIEGPAPVSGTELDHDAGQMGSHNGERGLALIRLEALFAAQEQKNALTCGETRLWPEIPAWMKIDVSAATR